MGLRYCRSCINIIRLDFPNALLDLSGLNFDAMFVANTVSYGVPDLVDSLEEFDRDNDEDFSLKVNLADDVE